MQLPRLFLLLTIVIFFPGSPDSLAAPEDAGASVYRNICAACHGDEGQGVPGTYPPSAGSTYLDGDPGAAIRIVLHGLEGPLTSGGETINAVMPPNAEILTDEEIAAVLNHARQRWGSSAAKPITASAVAAVRTKDPERVKMWTVAELEALAPTTTAKPPPPPTPASAGSPPPHSSPPTASRPVPWPIFGLLALPMGVFLIGVVLVSGTRE
jgi:mono/diheme cytochrome c family protein